jgi:hypothetical protein
MKPIIMISSRLLLIVCLIAPLRVAQAQADNELRSRLTVVDSTRLQVLTLKDGSTIFGRVVALNGDTASFQTSGAGTIQLPIASIREVKEVSSTDIHEGSYWFPNPNATRLFFAPTGQMLERGEGYVSDYLLFFPGIAYGVTDNITIGGGVSLLPAAVDEQIYYLTPKVGFSVAERVHLAAGVLFAGGRGGTGGIGYGVATFGDGNASASLGAGYGFAGGKIESKPVAMVGGEVRVSPRIGFVTENYLLPVSDNNVLYSFGIRFMGDKLTTDLALFNVSGSEVIGIPFVDFVFRF